MVSQLMKKLFIDDDLPIDNGPSIDDAFFVDELFIDVALSIDHETLHG